MNDPLVTVRLLAAPLKLWARSDEHHDEVLREMVLLTLSLDEQRDEPGVQHTPLPARLVELSRLFGVQFGASADRPEGERLRALSHGADRLDVEYEVPASVGPAAVALFAMLDEVEEFCRQGEGLLSLARPPDQQAFTTWFAHQFGVQCAGGPATPWPGPWT